MNEAEKGFHDLIVEYGSRDFSDLESLLEEYYEIRRVYHRLNREILKTEASEKKKTSESEQTLAELAAELRALADAFCAARTLKPLFLRFLQRKTRHNPDPDTRPDVRRLVKRIHRSLMKILLKFRKRLPMDLELEGMVESSFLDRVRSKLLTWLKKNSQHVLLDNPDDWVAGFLEHVRSAVRELLYDRYPALFDPDRRSDLNEKRQDREEAEAESAETRQKVLNGFREFNEFLNYLEKFRDSIRVKVLEDLILGKLLKILSGVIRGSLPKNKDYPARQNRIDAGQLEIDLKRIIRQQFRLQTEEQSSPVPRPRPAGRSHSCGAPLLSRRGKCKRPTTNEGFCYQHEFTVPSGDALTFVGSWRMSGKQENVPRSHWKASLELRKNGTLQWKQTAGANLWAKRTGRWRFEKGVLSMSYRAPRVGIVEWTSRKMRAGSKSMGGDYRTPQVAAKGKGWGGEWHASRIR